MSRDREIKVGDWGWFWWDEPGTAMYGKILYINKVDKKTPFESFDACFQNFSHEHPTKRFVVLTKEEYDELTTGVRFPDQKAKPETVKTVKAMDDPYAELKKAYGDGKTIQVWHEFGNDWLDIYTKSTDGAIVPNWEFPIEEYRIKPEQRYRAYTFQDSEEFKNLWVMRTGLKTEFRIDSVSEVGIKISDEVFVYGEAFDKLKHTDGTPFGKLIEE